MTSRHGRMACSVSEAEPDVHDEVHHHMGNRDRCGVTVHGRVLEFEPDSCPPRLLTDSAGHLLGAGSQSCAQGVQALLSLPNL